MTVARLPFAIIALGWMTISACAEPTTYPLTIENCGAKVTIEKAPQRAVGLGQNSSEIMLMLGLADRMAGTAVWVSPVLSQLAADNAKVQRIANNTPTFEAVVARQPDFIAAQFLTTVGPQGRVGTRQQFLDLGVPSYISPTDCAVTDNTRSDGTRKQMLTMDLLYQEIDELSRIFDVADRGQALITQLKEREDTVRQRVAGKAKDVRLIYWFSSPDVAGDAWVAGRNGASGYITKVIGARNVVDSEQEWPLVGWETIASANPTVIVIGTMDRRTQGADDPVVKRKFLTTDPVVSRLDAVEKGRIVELDAQAMNPTIRTITGLETVAAALEQYGLLK
ncbi:ABC transporter substrate-binding protein [Microvirga lotononidis]|uniref:ABC-type Fe3+-hydroxamate transport system, periplasmic component n=1 Tax=Microvirga lotononidis TaxID=864069 RepID=I4Z102_9HYPH|nr:ABC transporter substrate-binding protein [Microvirga lotononidis]EIM29894.1 ABC-type Fe3+-hydroxamate transport system, periplasmic component [Microvirga lotononidis]WQO31027.1 ABC transporter substrate-binding protein [Microvirga lotononidis]